MVGVLLAFSRYYTALLYGALIAVGFSGMVFTKKNRIVFFSFTLFLFLLQVISFKLFGMAMTLKVYPLLSHLPVVLFIALYLKRSFLISFTAVFASFLCCQPPRFIGTVAREIFDSVSMDHLGYILSAILFYLLLKKYAFNQVNHLMNRSVYSCLMFGSVPFLYYVYDQLGSVYTNLTYSGERVAVQFMPFITAAFFFIFVLIYYSETQKQQRLQREKELLDTQFKLAQKEFDSFKQMEEANRAYRHDMRHHSNLLLGFAKEGRLDLITEYLKDIKVDIEKITPKKYCENETVNLILSSYGREAEEKNIEFVVDAKLPVTIPLTDTELCSVLSNALENAFNAVLTLDEKKNREIQLRAYEKNEKLCIEAKNRYGIEPVFIKGLPVSNEMEHGFGTKSMANIIRNKEGVFRFYTENGWFIFQAVL